MKKILIPCTALVSDLLPQYATPLSAGADLRAAIEEPLTLMPQEILLVPTGISLEIPEGYEVQLRPRSGLALKGITLVNSPGTIDADYRGEIKVILINHSSIPFSLTPRMRIAQLVLSSVVQAEFLCQEAIECNTLRGKGGFGHTGTT